MGEFVGSGAKCLKRGVKEVIRTNSCGNKGYNNLACQHTPRHLKAEYEYIVERTFLSEDNGYEFFNAFARNKGFSLRKGKVTRARNKDDMSSRQYVCSKAGARQPKFLIREEKKRRPRPVTRFDCPFEVVIKHNPEMDVWRNESQLDCEASQSIPVGIIEHHVLETSAANCCTPANFYLVQKEIKRTRLYDTGEILESDVSTKYIVVAKDGTKVFEVECDDEETLGNVSYSCLKFECEGIPCCHIMVVLIRLGAMMPQCCVLNRWTLNAKSGSCLETGDHVNSMKGTRFSELLMLARLIFQEASCSIDEYLRWKEILEHEHKEKRKREDTDGESRTTEDQDNNLEAEASPINVQDPEIVQSKGAPKRFKNFLDMPNKRRCSECKATDHDKRTCPKIKR
ncbi:hypothetical protein C2845_PM05G12950 [Panicum miliaceum]|uniref:Protein FAR1-RELATED SEQUENCE n=1 Tax=Panicum miliaceum TaxID=4540 RepID=A0A3L6T689_PANMI|nr:hypothetical protein C2845_PM05G12950 [Panicum miliaceum]